MKFLLLLAALIGVAVLLAGFLSWLSDRMTENDLEDRP